MKRIAAALLVAVLVVSFAGCGGGNEEDGGAGNLSLLAESTAAMAEVNSYRISGIIEMDAGAVMSGGQGQVISMDVVADVQNVGGDMRQHMTVTMGDYVAEAYIVEGVYYQNVPGQGWLKMSSGAYMSQNMGLGLANADQMEIMAQLAKDARVVEENDEAVVLSFHLDQEYMEAAMDLYRKYMEEGDNQVSEEWLSMAEETISDFQADMSIWIDREDHLIQRMEMTYTMGGLSQTGEISSSMVADFFDYGADIVIELPAEAAEAREYDFSQ